MKSMAIHVEDHPVSYSSFEGTIPAKQYGAGTVIVWDRGTWEPVGDPREGLTKGKVLFKLHGQKLAGLWELVRISKPGAAKQDQWMLFKKRGDAWARPLAEYDVITALPDSVIDKPLGPGRGARARANHGRAASPTLSLDEESAFALAEDAPLPANLGATACDAGVSGLAERRVGCGKQIRRLPHAGPRRRQRRCSCSPAMATTGRPS